MRIVRVLSVVRRSFYTAAARMQDTRPPGHRQLRMDHLRMMNYKMDVDLEKVEATVKTSGLHYTDFDAKSTLPKPWQLMKILESARFFSHHWPLDDDGHTFRDYAEVTADRMTFLITSSFDIDRGMYDFSIPKCPLLIKVKGGYVGKSSMNSVATVLSEDGKILLSNINQVVSIDKATRRPMQLPDWWREKYANSDTPSLVFHKVERPIDLVPFKAHVCRSDIDGNNHCNWSCYVRFSMDALYHHAKHGHIKSFDNLEKRGLQRMELLFSGESFDDDVLNVYVWQQDENSSQVTVHVEKLGQFLFQGSFKYFDEELY